jgi:C4-dicarboxylate-specific signal transduction histidine kinase
VQVTEGIVQSKYQELVNFKSELPECIVELSVFWFEIFLTNLIRNALAYGKQPINVYITKESPAEVAVIVEDQGEVNLKFLRSLLNPIIKVKSSKGLGIGLKIVARKMKEIGGQLEVHAQPTRFVLKFKCKETA